MKQFVLLLACFLVSLSSYPQVDLKKKREKIWNLSSCIGTAFFTAELGHGLSVLKPELIHLPGFTANISATRIFKNRIEPGVSLEFSTFNGYNNNPDFSANGFQYHFRNPVTDPVKYSTQLIVPSFYIRYNFKDVLPPKRKKYYLNYFVEVKLGAAFLITGIEYRYKPEEPPIFVKGKGVQPLPGLNAQYSLGAGLRFDYNPKWGLLFLVDINIDNYDSLDAVHNYSPLGERLQLMGVYSRIMVGASYTLNTKKKKSRLYNRFRKSRRKPQKTPWSGGFW